MNRRLGDFTLRFLDRKFKTVEGIKFLEHGREVYTLVVLVQIFIVESHCTLCWMGNKSTTSIFLIYTSMYVVFVPAYVQFFLWRITLSVLHVRNTRQEPTRERWESEKEIILCSAKHELLTLNNFVPTLVLITSNDTFFYCVNVNINDSKYLLILKSFNLNLCPNSQSISK